MLSGISPRTINTVWTAAASFAVSHATMRAIRSSGCLDDAAVAAPVRSMHHLLVEYYQLDDVGQGYDLLQSTQRKSSPHSAAIRTTS
jgi:hypothetical protein